MQNPDTMLLFVFTIHISQWSYIEINNYEKAEFIVK